MWRVLLILGFIAVATLAGVHRYRRVGARVT
ncbi:hypothetical protein A8926_4710 [Saccharopolyspora spinosa]|uniref:Uncharacterized protein n=1 Tax=Saccharopolyspora spinosa TaxID=60894 RepID=A0A2N3Y1K3_SACSN|nr:hypothetical protein A8926_4710 [Saccharopolyspora spinosa]